MNNKSLFNTTIVGVSTALAQGAISIVRVSGDEAITIVNKIFKEKDLTKVKSHTITYGHIYNPRTGSIIDEVLVSIFRSPRSYTTEDVVEINCHGGILVTNTILNLVVENGAKLALAGEFTKRAFLNGRIDLTKAEAVMDVISAQNKKALELANHSLKGDIKKMVEELQAALLDIIANIAVNIDYPEYDDVEEVKSKEIKPKLEDIYVKIEEVINNAENVFLIKNGIDTVIIGKPNVGKSSLLNALIQEKKAIVTNIPGTTRDVIESKLNIGSITINLIDTAGVRDAKDEVEKIGVDLTKKKLDVASLVLLVFDGGVPLSKEDLELIKLVKEKNKKYIYIINKNDLPQKIDETLIPNAIKISALQEEGIKELEDSIYKIVFTNNFDPGNIAYISNARQLECMKTAKKALEEALVACKDDTAIDVIDLFLQEAWHSLGEILGDVSDDSLLNELFSKFCLGK